MGKHRRPPERRATYREVFAVREFRALWFAQVLSYVGDQLAQVALAFLVYERTDSPGLTAMTYALTYLPPIAGGPILSGLADLFPRRTVMIVCDLVRAAIVAVMAIPGLPFPGLCALLFVVVLLSAPFGAARAALMPDVLPGDQYVAGSAISNITHQATQMVGFAVGGGIVAAVGAFTALGIDAVTFALSALLLAVGVRRRPAARREANQRTSLMATTKEGVRLVFGNRTLRSLVLFAWLCGFPAVTEGLAVPYADRLGGGAETAGLLLSAMPTGMVIGAFVFSRLVQPSDRIRAMGWMAMLSCAPLVVIAVQPPLWVALLLWMLSGVGSAYQLAANAAFVAAVPHAGRGQAFGLAASGIQAVQGIGILAGGGGAELLGPEPTIALAGAAGLVVAAWLSLSWTRVRGQVVLMVRQRA